MAPLSDKTMTEPGHSVRIPWNSDTVELVSFGYVLVDNPQPLDEFQRELAEMELSFRTGMSARNSGIREGEPCDHPGCLKHLTHPCEGCGRVGGRSERQEDGK
jgi:hypothetical protein